MRKVGYNLRILYTRHGKLDQAEAPLKAALKIKPDLAEASE
jgi:hypothetical protein